MKLLPSEIMRTRQRYNIGIKLAALQAVIFLFLVLFVMVIDFSIRSHESQSTYLSMQLQDVRFIESEALVAILREYNANENAQAEIAQWLDLPLFNTDRLDMIEETLPSGVQLFSIDKNERGASLTLQTRNLSLVDIHREALMSTGLISWVQLDSATSGIGGIIQYSLSLNWHHEG